LYRVFFRETQRNETTWKKKGLGGRIILKRFLRKLEGWTWAGFL
jgi:hypothetical protein